MKIMPENDSYASGEYPEDFCIRVRTPFSPWDTEFSFFASRDSCVRRRRCERLRNSKKKKEPDQDSK
jgi:hypothetical protein